MPASDVGQRLREARKAAGLTLRELAERAGIANYQTIDNIERARQRASVDQIECLARALGVSPAWLAFGTKERQMDDLHFWTSTQARRARQRSITPYKQNYALIAGQKVAYDIAASTEDHGCTFTDMVYLGRGTWLSCEGANV